MKTKSVQSKQQAFEMLAFSGVGMNQKELAEKYGVSQTWVSMQLHWARNWEKIAKDIQTYKEAWENTAEMSTNGFPGHMDNTGEEE